ncbi:hypothetical protein GB928_028885 [Shinella curvata]|uniref:Uncharacterized protein n=1 Tax=Shinella curvata TaxID=1817964 RepID=A0ABT8XN74_9HYPH|nr:hypothetical protein [Shinella curvata]MCJ8057312.1 hypothetical protein [Shinella curvata]MDO6125201.1 hypothetical protein [Shinella curvata]
MGNAELRFKLTEMMLDRKKHRDSLVAMERKSVSLAWPDGKTTAERIEEETAAIGNLLNMIKAIQVASPAQIDTAA